MIQPWKLWECILPEGQGSRGIDTPTAANNGWGCCRVMGNSWHFQRGLHSWDGRRLQVQRRRHGRMEFDLTTVSLRAVAGPPVASSPVLTCPLHLAETDLPSSTGHSRFLQEAAESLKREFSFQISLVAPSLCSWRDCSVFPCLSSCEAGRHLREE